MTYDFDFEKSITTGYTDTTLTDMLEHINADIELINKAADNLQTVAMNNRMLNDVTKQATAALGELWKLQAIFIIQKGLTETVIKDREKR
jgi:hypothetical protein